MANQERCPYSQEQDWDVQESEQARISETELAEIRRLRDSSSSAERVEPHAVLLRPKLPEPIAIPVRQEKRTLSRLEVKETIEGLAPLSPFQDHFPEEFEPGALASHILEKARLFTRSPYSSRQIILMTTAQEMSRLIERNSLPDDDACTATLRSFQIEILESLYPTMKLLKKALLISAYDLKLPESLAEERSEKIALKYLEDFFHDEMVITPIIPPHPKMEKALSEALLRAIELIVPKEKSRSLIQKIILGLNIETKLVQWVKSWRPFKEIRQAPLNPLWNSLEAIPEGFRGLSKAAMKGCLLISTLLYPSPLNLAFSIPLLTGINTPELAAAFKHGLKTGMASAPAATPLVMSRLAYICRLLIRLGCKELQIFLSNESEIDEKTQSILERQCALVAPTETQTRQFIQWIAGKEAAFKGIKDSSIEI